MKLEEVKNNPEIMSQLRCDLDFLKRLLTRVIGRHRAQSLKVEQLEARPPRGDQGGEMKNGKTT